MAALFTAAADVAISNDGLALIHSSNITITIVAAAGNSATIKTKSPRDGLQVHTEEAQRPLPAI